MEDIPYLYELGRYDEVMELIQRNDVNDFRSQIYLSLAKIRQGNYEEVSNILEILGNVESPSNDNLAALEYVRGYYRFKRGETLLDATYLQTLNNLLHEDLDAYWEGKISNLLSIIHGTNGDFDSAVKHADFAIKCYEDYQHSEIMIARVKNNLSGFHFEMGKYSLAIDNLEDVLRINRELNNIPQVARVLSNLASLYAARGELEKSLKMQKDALSLKQELGNLQDIAITLSRIGNLYLQMHKFDLSKEYHTQAYENRLTLQNPLNLVFSEYDLFRVNYYIGDNEEVSKFLDLLLIHDDDHPRVKLRQQIAKALHEKSKKTIIGLANAQAIFKEVISKEAVEFNLWLQSIFSYCEILLIEASIDNSSSVLEEVEELLDTITNKAIEENSYLISVDLLYIRSKFSSLSTKYKEAIAFLDEAEQICKSNGLALILDKITQEKDLIQNKISSYSKMKRPQHNEESMEWLQEYLKEVSLQFKS